MLLDIDQRLIEKPPRGARSKVEPRWPAGTGSDFAYMPRRQCELVHELLDFRPRDAITRHEQSYNRVVQQIAQYRFFVAVPATRHGALLQAIIRRSAVFTAFARPAARARPAVVNCISRVRRLASADIRRG